MTTTVKILIIVGAATVITVGTVLIVRATKKSNGDTQSGNDEGKPDAALKNKALYVKDDGTTVYLFNENANQLVLNNKAQYFKGYLVGDYVGVQGTFNLAKRQGQTWAVPIINSEIK